MPLVPVQPRDEPEAEYEIKIVKLGLAMKKDGFESPDSFLDILNENRKELGSFQQPFTKKDVAQTEDLFYVITGKRYDKVIDEVLIKTSVRGILCILDSYKWKQTKKPQQTQLLLR